MHMVYLGSIGKEWGSEMGKGRNPINGVLSSRLSLWATEAQLNWGNRGGSVACALEVSPHQSQPQEMRKRGYLFSNACQSWAEGYLLGDFVGAIMRCHPDSPLGKDLLPSFGVGGAVSGQPSTVHPFSNCLRCRKLPCQGHVLPW